MEESNLKTKEMCFSFEMSKMQKFIRIIWAFFAIWSLALMGYATFTHTEHGWFVKIALLALGLLAIPILSFIGYRSMVKFWEQ